MSLPPDKLNCRYELNECLPLDPGQTRFWNIRFKLQPVGESAICKKGTPRTGSAKPRSEAFSSARAVSVLTPFQIPSLPDWESYDFCTRYLADVISYKWILSILPDATGRDSEK